MTARPTPIVVAVMIIGRPECARRPRDRGRRHGRPPYAITEPRRWWVIEVGRAPGWTSPSTRTSCPGSWRVEPESNLKSLAERAPKRALIGVEVIGGHAEDLPAPDTAFDAAMASLALARPGSGAASREIGGGRGPGADLRLLENVRATTPRVARVQRAIDANVWPWFAGGCHTSRDTVAAIDSAGLPVGRLDWPLLLARRVRFPTSSMCAASGPGLGPSAPSAVNQPVAFQAVSSSASTVNRIYNLVGAKLREAGYRGHRLLAQPGPIVCLRCSGSGPVARYRRRMVKPGDKAPDFTLLDQNGEPFSLSESIKRRKVWHLVYFYP
jgi:hypothetical protein